jgi:hypothetical protein
MGPKHGHCCPSVLSAVWALNPIPILGVGHCLFNDAKDLAVVFRAHEAKQGALMVGRKILADDTVERDSTGPQHVLETVDKQFEFPLNQISVFELSRGLKFSAVVGPLVFQIDTVGRILASLQVPVHFVSEDLAATSVVLDPPDKAFQSADKGTTNPDASAVGCELGDCGTDVRHVLQQHLSEVAEAPEPFGNDRSALAFVPANLG